MSEAEPRPGQVQAQDSSRTRIEGLVTEVGGAGDPDEVLAGLDSLALVELVVGIESALELEIPDEILTDEMFRSVDALTEAIDRLRLKL